jgi:hypothetical protein
MCDWEGCTTGTIGLPNPNQRRFVKTSGFLNPYIYRYTARVHRDRFLAFEGEGMTWMRQPSWQGIALFSVRMEFWRSTASAGAGACPRLGSEATIRCACSARRADPLCRSRAQCLSLHGAMCSLGASHSLGGSPRRSRGLSRSPPWRRLRGGRTALS